jgi:hypothetical protein
VSERKQWYFRDTYIFTVPLGILYSARMQARVIVVPLTVRFQPSSLEPCHRRGKALLSAWIGGGRQLAFRKVEGCIHCGDAVDMSLRIDRQTVLFVC